MFGTLFPPYHCTHPTDRKNPSKQRERTNSELPETIRRRLLRLRERLRHPGAVAVRAEQRLLGWGHPRADGQRLGGGAIWRQEGHDGLPGRAHRLHLHYGLRELAGDVGHRGGLLWDPVGYGLLCLCAVIEVLGSPIALGLLGTGVFQTLTTAYASEVTPIQLRGYLTAYVRELNRHLCPLVGRELTFPI